MADDMPPDWAIERALTLGFTGTKLEDVRRHWAGHTVHIAFARYIAAHEEPPVDPFTECINLILGGFEGEHHARQYADSLREELAKRGLEIREVQP